jgi:integrase
MAKRVPGKRGRRVLKTVLRFPDLDLAKSAVLNSLSSTDAQRGYRHALTGIERFAPHDLRRTCARLCHGVGGELEQIQFLLGHVSSQTTERYLGCKQRIRSAVNDRIGIEPAA